MFNRLSADSDRLFMNSWIWLLVLYSLAGFIETVFWGQMGAFTPLYLPKLGIAPEDVRFWVGAIGAFTSAVGIPFLPFWGALADRYSRKPIIIRSFFAHLFAGIFTVLAGNIWVFILGRAMSSFALGNSGLMMTTLSERTPRQRMGLAFSIMNAAPPIGAFVGPLVGGPIVDRFGFQTLIAFDVGLMLMVILALAFGYRDNFVGSQRGPLLQMAIDSVRLILASPRLRTLFPALFLLFAGWMLAFTYVPLAIMSLYQGPEPGTTVGLVLGAGGVLTLFLSPMIGALADRFGHWRVLFMGSLVAVLLWPLPAFAPNLVFFGIAWALLNSVVSSVFAISFSVLAESAPGEVRGRVMSFAYLPVNVGGLVGPAIGSLIAVSSVMNVFPVAAILTAFGILAMFLASKRPI